MWLKTVWALVALFISVSAIPKSQFLPYGSPYDNLLPSGDTVSSNEILLSVPIRFFSELHASIYVNINGLLSFLTELPVFYNIQFPMEYPIIAPLYSNIDTRSSGAVYYRETQDSKLLEQTSQFIRRLYPDLEERFEARSLFIVTWDKVGYFDGGFDKVNTFQAVIASDGDESFVQFLYADSGIQWVQGRNRISALPDIRAQAGIVSQDGRLFTLRGSGTEQVKNLDRWSNTNMPGVYMFRIGNIPDGENVEPPQIILEENLETDEDLNTCTACSIYCHAKADCFDTSSGYCCRCQNGYIGNGRNCFMEGNPLRVTGKLNIDINDVIIKDLDLQSYVVTADGKSYTAVSGVPHNIGNQMQLVESLGSIIAWMFAKPKDEAKNGFQLTGGVFNHTSELSFDGGDKIIIRQKYLGFDVYDQIKMEAEISGHLPYVPAGTTLRLPDFHETFSKYRPGSFRSQHDQVINLDRTDESYKFLKVQWIEYSEYCTELNEEIPALQLKLARNYIQYDEKERILRFSSTNKISINRDGDDPCIEGQVKCVANSSCIAEGNSFKCVCNHGFDTLYQEGRSEELGCVDINECREGTAHCDTNAICVNEVGSYACQCKPGFEGDGKRCEVVQRLTCSTLLCPENSVCEEYHEEVRCVCKHGYHGEPPYCEPYHDGSRESCHTTECSDGEECRETYDGPVCICKQNYSGEPPNCVPNEIPGEPSCVDFYCPEGSECELSGQGARCVCKPNYSGEPPYCTRSSIFGCSSDFECSPSAQCIKNESSGDYSCVCQPGYIGDGYICYEYMEGTMIATCKDEICWCPSDYMVRGDLCVKIKKGDKESCHIHNTCHHNAQCIHTENLQEYKCVCNPGYEGNGSYCEPYEISCDKVNICDLHATCKHDASTDRHICICNIGYQGDGTICFASGGECQSSYECSNHAECISNECVCNEGYIKEDQECVPLQRGKCRSSNDCGRYGECISNVCVCTDVHSWNGRECLASLNCGPCKSDVSCQSSLTEEGRLDCKCREDLTGDGNRECKDTTLSCAILQNCSPYASCVYVSEEVGHECQCEDGYEGNGITCNPIKNCLNTQDLCSSEASCVINVNDEYECRCNEGFAGNGSFCKEIKREGEEFLLINQGRSTLRIPFKQSRFNRGRPIQVHEGQTVGIASDCVDGRVYWSDISQETIKSSNYDGSDVKDFLTSGIVSPEGLAIDWENRNIYWTDSELDTISYQNLDSGEKKVIVSDGLVNPRGIAVHPQRRKVFWSDWNRDDPKLEWADLDGSHRDVLVKGPHVVLPNSLAIDWDTDEVCWADAGTQTIECLRIGTKTRRTAVQKCRYPFGLAITPEKYYWTDWVTHKIETASKETGEIQEPIDMPLGGGDKLYGIVAVVTTCPH